MFLRCRQSLGQKKFFFDCVIIIRMTVLWITLFTLCNNAVLWRPLVELCPICQPKRTHRHETHLYIENLLNYLKWTPNRGIFVDGGPAEDMSDGFIALKMGFTVVAVEPRSAVYWSLLQTHNFSVSTNKLTLLHSALSNVSKVGEIHNAAGASSLSIQAASARGGKYLVKYQPRTATLKKEHVIVTTLDTIVGAQKCAVVKLDIQGYEHEALLGASSLLNRPAEHAPIIMFELLETLRREIPINLGTIQYLQSFNYTCYDVTSKKSNSLPDGSLKHMHRCCKNVTSSVACKVWYDESTKICQDILYTDFVCLKH